MKPQAKVQGFRAFSDIVVIGYNPENADYDNPKGEIYGYAAYVQAVSPRGDTWIKHVRTDRFEVEVMVDASKLADALNARLTNFDKLPVGFEGWQQGRTIFGTEAYIEYGQAEEWALESSEDGLPF